MIHESELPTTYSCGQCLGLGYVVGPMPLPAHRRAQGITEHEWDRMGYTSASPCVACEPGQKRAAGHWRRYIHHGDLSTAADPDRAKEFLDEMDRLGIRGHRIKQFFDNAER